jgi:hypothetical protein
MTMGLSFENLSQAASLFGLQQQQQQPIHPLSPSRRERSNSDASNASNSSNIARLLTTSDDGPSKFSSVNAIVHALGDMGIGLSGDDDDASASPEQQRLTVASNNDSNWDASVAINLKDLAWLSPQQKQAMEHRLSSAAVSSSGSISSSSSISGADLDAPAASGSHATHSSESSSYFSGLFSSSSSSMMPSISSSAHSAASTSNRKGGSMFSMFQSKSTPLLGDDDLAGGNEDHAGRLAEVDSQDHSSNVTSATTSASTITTTSTNTATSINTNSTNSTGTPDDTSARSTVALSETERPAKLTCYRCNGSVEGPKYSTCKCAIPALSPEEASAEHGAATAGIMGYFGMFKTSK